MVAFLGILVTIVAGGGVNNHVQAEQEAKTFATKIYGAADANASCMDRDTDNDGYVSCTVVYNQGGQQITLPLACAAKHSFNEGCKLVVPVYNVH